MTFINTIFVPQGAEYQAVCRGLKQVQTDRVRVISIPVGMKHVQQTIASNYFRSSNSPRVLIMGLCGSLSKQYSVGKVVLYQGCCNLDGQKIDLDVELTTAIEQKLSVDLVMGLTSDRLVHQTKEKIILSQTYPVSVVDMEGYGYLKELQTQGIPVSILRVVSDDLTGDIPDLTQAIDRNGNLKTGSMAIAFLQQPISAIRLIQGSLTGLKTLKQVTQRLFIDE